MKEVSIGNLEFYNEVTIDNLELYDEVDIGDLEHDVKLVSVGGTLDYDDLDNKPKINDVELKGNKTFENLGINTITNIELEEMLNREI